MPSFAQADIILALISMVFREGHIVKCNAEEDGHVSDIKEMQHHHLCKNEVEIILKA